MFFSGKSIRILCPFLTAIVFFATDTWGQTASPDPGEPVLVESLIIGPHPESTRILIHLDREGAYRVRPDFEGKRIFLYVEDSKLGPRVHPRIFKDKNLEKIEVFQLNDFTEITFYLKYKNTRFFHFQQASPHRIVLDIKGSASAPLNTRISPREKAEETPASDSSTSPSADKESSQPEKDSSGLSRKKRDNLLREDLQNKIRYGWDDYITALKTFQAKKYPEAKKLFMKFRKDYPKSPYLENIAYLMAETEFQIVFKDPHPLYEDTLKAYQFAIRKYPKSKFKDHALIKMAEIYKELGYVLEARTLYEKEIRNPRSIYKKSRDLGLASMLFEQNRLMEAYDAYQRYLKKFPRDLDAQKRVFEIANQFYLENRFRKALTIFEEANKRWPDAVNNTPITHFYMAEIYFRQQRFKRARKHYFDYFNLDPETPEAHWALNRIGDSFLIEKNFASSLAVFDQSSKRNPDSAPAQYATIRLADIGLRNPALPLRDVIFDVTPYYKPFETYNRISQNASTQIILAEATLSHGMALLQEQRYLEAIKKFKQLLPLDRDSKFHIEARKFIRQALIFMVDRYSKQKGYLPILYAFTDYQSLSLEELQNPKTILQIGEAFQAISMHQQAALFYEKAKKLDTQGLFTDRIFLNLGNLHLDRKNFKEAALVAKTFINRHSRSKLLPSAKMLLGAALRGQEKPKQALKIYRQMLDRRMGNKAEVSFHLGETYRSLNQLTNAVKAYRQAIKGHDRSVRRVPDYIPKAYYNLGFALYNTRKFKQASRILKLSRDMFPEHWINDWNRFLLADSSEKLNLKEMADSELNELIQSESADDVLKQVAKTRQKVLAWEKEFKELL